MYCKNCGTKIEDGTLYCPKCGYKQEVEEKTIIDVTPTVASNSTPSVNHANTSNNEFGASAILGIISLVTLFTGVSFILAIIGRCMAKNKRDKILNDLGIVIPIVFLILMIVFVVTFFATHLG